MGITSKGHCAIPLFEDVVHTYASHDTMHVDDIPSLSNQPAVPSQEKVCETQCEKSGAHHVDEQERSGQSGSGHDGQLEAGNQQEEAPGSCRQVPDFGTKPGPDQLEDEKDEGEQLGGKLLTTGKFKGKIFREVYLKEKDYLAWIRQNVSSMETKFSINMLEFRMYVESRDMVKRDRMMKQMMVEKFSKERPSAVRLTATECSWEEVMETENLTQEEKKIITLTEIQQYNTIRTWRI